MGQLKKKKEKALTNKLCTFRQHLISWLKSGICQLKYFWKGNWYMSRTSAVWIWRFSYSLFCLWKKWTQLSSFTILFCFSVAYYIRQLHSMPYWSLQSPLGSHAQLLPNDAVAWESWPRWSSSCVFW